MRKCNRRDFAKAALLGTLFTPFVDLLRPKEASAVVPGQAKYLFIFFTPGTEPSVWSPKGSSASKIAHSSMTEPLAPLNSNLVLIDKLDSKGTASNHGAVGGLTGAGFSGQPLVSVEQFASDQLRDKGVFTQIPNLVLGGVSAEAQTTFWREGRNVIPIFSPTAAYGAIFGGADFAFAGESPTGENPAEARLRRRQSMLDTLNSELGQLSQALGAEERVKLEAHADALRQMEQRLSQQSEAIKNPEPLAVQCKNPSEPRSSKDDLANSVIHTDLAINAFACDLTRIASVSYGHHGSTQVNIPEVGASGDWHQGFIHSDKPRKRLVNMERWLCKQFVKAAEQLKNTPAPDGKGSLFDQTLMLWARDMGDAVSHGGSDMRFVLSGGAGGYLRTGGSYINGGGQMHSKVLINALEALGITDVSGFGNADTALDPLDGLRA